MRAPYREEKIGAFCRTSSGGTPQKSDRRYYDAGAIPWLLSGEVNSREIHTARHTITKVALQETNAKLFPENTVLVAMYGATAGQVGILRFEAATNQAVCGIYPNDSYLPEYLYYALLVKQANLIATASGNAQPNISQKKIRDMTVPLPPLAEQKRIVAILDQAFTGIDKAIAHTETNLTNARELFEGYLHDLFTSADKKWNDERLGDICTFSSGGTPSKKNPAYWGGSIPWISGRDMKATRLDDSTLHITDAAISETSSHLAPAGTILTLVRGMGLIHGAQLGELTRPCAFNQDIRGIHAKDAIVPRYLLFALRHKINFTDGIIKTAAHGTKKLNSNELAELRIAMPPTDEQKKAVEGIDSIAEKSAKLAHNFEQQLTALTNLKQSLLHKAFSGELTTDPQRETEAALP